MNIDKILKSKMFRVGGWSLLVLIVLLVVFGAGVFVGEKKARFSYRWGENYQRNFAGPRGGFFGDFSREEGLINAHGAFGQIIKVDGSILIIKDKDNVEKIVLVNDQTTIRRGRDDVKVSDLKVDDGIVVIGDPNDSGQILAKLIRLMPSQPNPGKR